MRKVASIFGATLFGIFTGVANAGSPIALTESEMDAVTAGVRFFSSRLTTNQVEEPIIEQKPVLSFPSYSVNQIEELIIEEKAALYFPSYLAMEEYLQTINHSEITGSIAVATDDWLSDRSPIDEPLNYAYPSVLPATVAPVN